MVHLRCLWFSCIVRPNKCIIFSELHELLTAMTPYLVISTHVDSDCTEPRELMSVFEYFNLV